MISKKFLIILLVLVIIISAGVSIFFISTKQAPPAQQTVPTPILPTPTSTPTNTQLPNKQAPISSLASETNNWKTYKNQQFGIEFKYPETYEVVVETNRSMGHGLFFVGIRPKDWTNSEQFKLYANVDNPLEVWIDGMNFDEAATHAGFEKQNGRWVVLGRQGIAGEAKEITVQNWKGLQGITSIGFFSKSGDYAGLGEKIIAVVNRDNNLSAFLQMLPLISEDIFNKIVSTFRFIKETETVVNHSALSLRIYGGGELIVTDPHGHRTGLDPRTGTSFAEIPASNYGEENLGADDESGQVQRSKVLYIDKPLGGDYRIEVIGTWNGESAFDILPIDKNGDAPRITTQDTVAVGVSNIYQLTYSATPGQPAKLIRLK